MKKIIPLIIILIFLVSNISIALYEEPNGINIKPFEPKLSLVDWIKSLFLFKPLAVLPSGYTCDSKVDAIKKFEASSTTIKIGNACGGTSKIKLFECYDSTCSSYNWKGEDYKVEGVSPTFYGFIVGNYYMYFCYNCVGEQCTEGWVSGTRSCVGSSVYYDYKNTDCSTTKKLRGTCFENEICNTGSGSDCISEVGKCSWDNQLISKNSYFCPSSQNCNSENYYCDAFDVTKRKRIYMRDDCVPITYTYSCGSNEICNNGNCIKLSCSYYNLQSCSLLNKWTDLGCGFDSQGNPVVIGKVCTDIGNGLLCFSKEANRVKEYCKENEVCENAKCVEFVQTCIDYGLEECPNFLNQWIDLKCGVDSSGNNAIIGRRCTDMGLATPCYQKGFLTKERCPQECRDTECVGFDEQTCEEMGLEKCSISLLTSQNFRNLQCSMDKTKIEGEKCQKVQDSSGKTHECWGTKLKNVYQYCKENEVCDGKTATCTVQGEDCRTNGCPEGEECKETGIIFKKWECTTIPTGCQQCGAGLLNIHCSVGECHSLGCFVSEENKGIGSNKEQIVINKNNCIPSVSIGKQCDSYFEQQKEKGKKVNQTMDDTCITGYCKKIYVEKSWFGKLMAGFIATKKPVYVCSEKPEGYCKYFVWTEKVPFVDGDNACQIGTLLVLIILVGLVYFTYTIFYKKKGKKKKR